MEPCLNSPGPPGKAKSPERPIVNKYCEGKVKSTPNRGEIEPETLRLQAVGVPLWDDGVPLHNEPTSYRL